MPTSDTAPEVNVPTAQQKQLRGRPRSEHSHEAILGAVLALLEEEGYQAITIEGVARHAGVGKQTIYRWWKCKAELVLETFASHSASKVPIPDKGSLRGDLEAFLSTGFKRLTDISGPIMRGLIADAVHDDAFRQVLLTAFVAKRQDALKVLLARGIERNELTPDADLDLICDMVFGPTWQRLLLRNGKLDARFARQLTGAILAAFAPRLEGAR